MPAHATHVARSSIGLAGKAPTPSDGTLVNPLPSSPVVGVCPGKTDPGKGVKARQGRHGAPATPGYQPANPEPDGATRGNVAQTVANFVAWQDGPCTGARRDVRGRRFRGGRPQRAVLGAGAA